MRKIQSCMNGGCVSYNFTVDWTTANTQFWLDLFKKAGKDINDSITMLELGVFEGRTSCWISDTLLNHPDSTLLCVDNICDDRQSIPQILGNIRLSKNRTKVTLHVQDINTFFLRHSNLTFDAIYVDANHTYEAVMEDGANAYKHLNPNGILIFDDYESESDNCVGPAVRDLEKIWDLKLLGTGYQRAYIKSEQL